MTAIWIEDAGGWRIASSAGFPDEASLHSLVEDAPHVLPLAGSPRLVVLGREVRLGTGYADLLAIEESGRPTVIEVKLAYNSEARRAVVTQVLGYAAHLRGVSPDQLDVILARHLQQRDAVSVADAVAASDQSGSFDRESFSSNLDANLTEGRFRLVIVLDEAPAELVHLVGYLEAVSDKPTIDLIVVARYDVAGSQLLVPQRIDPERQVTQSRPATSRSDDEGYLVAGSADFAAAIETAPEACRPLLRRLAAWANELEVEGLVRLSTYHGKREIVTLLPRLKADDAGLVTIWRDTNSGYLQFWRSVFERRAPGTLARLEERLGPTGIKQGNVVREIDEQLLALLTDAYREAASGRVGDVPV